MSKGFRLRPEEESDRDYSYVDGIYTFEVNGREWEVDEDTLAEVQHRYSFEGDNWTQQEISQVYDIPRKVLEVILRKAGIFKASAAWTRERLEAVEDPSEFEDLASATYEARAHSYQAKQMRHTLREQRKELDRLRDEKLQREQMSQAFRAGIEKMAGFKSWKVEKFASARRKGEPWVCHAPMADAHLGLFVWGKEQWGGDYDLSIGKDAIIQHARDVAEWIRSQPGRCEALYFTDVGDYFHAVGGTTEHGTPLHQDSRSKKVIEQGTEAKFEAVEILRRVAGKVVLKGSNGNHDHLFHHNLFQALRYYFRTADDVEVFDTTKPEAHFFVGNTCHVLIHGYRLGKLSTPSSKMKLDIMLHEVVGEDYERARHFVSYCGHLHEVEVATHGRKNLMMRLPAACPSDEYAQMLWYSHVPGAQTFRLDSQGRIADSHNTFFDYHQDS